MEPTMPAIFELEAREQDQVEKDYRDWCKKFDPNYIVEQGEDEYGDRYIKNGQPK